MHFFKTLVSRFATPLLLLWWLGSFIATHLPVSVETPGLPYADKISHVVIYAGLAFLCALTWQKHATVGIRHMWAIFIILLFYSCLDEFLQGFVGRTPNIWDGVANVAGIFLGFIVFIKLDAPKTSGSL